MSESITSTLKQKALDCGFDLVGIAPAVTPSGFHPFCEWLENGFAGEMHYLERRKEAYERLDLVLDGVKSLVLLAVNYHTVEPPELKPSEGRVSRYAWSGADYHDVLRKKMKPLADFLHSEIPDCKTRGVVDTAPVLERDFAKLAGLGWFGKNTMLINKHIGSWFFLAALLVDFELEYDQPHESSHCGTCTRCLDACPTDAFPEPHVLDASKCISYLTIELRNAPVPIELRDKMGEWVFGCDICQDVCPWNRKAPISLEPAFQPTTGLSPVNAIQLLQTDDAQFKQRFKDTPLYRTDRAALLRNAAIALGNAGDRAAIPVLVESLKDSEALIRGAAAWALGKIAGGETVKVLELTLNGEANSEVQEELTTAIQKLCET